MKKGFLCIVVAVLLLGLTSCGNANSEAAYDCCKDLRGMCYDPKEFTIYDDVVCIETEEHGQLLYISFGATNSKGTGFKDIAIYGDNDFKGLWSYDESDFSSQNEYDEFMIYYKLPYEFYDPDSESEDSYSIPGKDIAKKLDVEHIELK